MGLRDSPSDKKTVLGGWRGEGGMNLGEGRRDGGRRGTGGRGEGGGVEGTPGRGGGRGEGGSRGRAGPWGCLVSAKWASSRVRDPKLAAQTLHT